MIEKIKSKMLNLDLKHPFSSGDFYQFFNYSFHRDFLRYLDKPKFYKHLQFTEFNKVVSRRSETVSMDREVFLEICEHRKIDTSGFMDYYYQYHKNRVKNSTEYFPNLKKGEKHTLDMYNRPAGKYYSHSLNTVNLADALLIDPYDLYKYCVTELKYKHCAYKADVTDPFMHRGLDNLPYLSYDNINDKFRYSYLNLIRLVIEEYPLNRNQRELALHYNKCIKDLISKVAQIEHMKSFNRDNAKRQALKITPRNVDPKKLQDALREGAKLFHPDRNPSGLELFKEFNNHYMNKDIRNMEKMINDYKLKIRTP